MLIKQRYWFHPLSIAICCSVFSASLSAQSDVAKATNITALNQLSVQLKNRSEAARTYAKNLAKRSGLPERLELPSGAVMEIQRVSPTGVPIYYITNNADAADTVSTDEVWPTGAAGLNLDGSGMKVGEWDEAKVLTTHPELTGRVTQMDSPDEFSQFHSTHVAGTLIAAGVVPAAQGMAYAATLDAWDWKNDTSEMAAAAANGLLLSNHSYGNATGWLETETGWWWFGGPLDTDVEDYNFGYYNADAQAWDQIAFNAPYYLIVKSIGNDRDDLGPPSGTTYTVVDVDGNPLFTSTVERERDCYPDGYDCTPTISTAKNILSVGAVDAISGGYSSAQGVVMSGFSGWGPTDDGRIKPDIVANGVGVYSPIALPWPFDYFELDGTSMAAPNVTGSLLLLQEHYQDLHAGNSMRAASLKALAIHTADETGAADGPDYQYGWGLLNTESAARVISEDGGAHRIMEDTLSAASGSTKVTQINVNEPNATITATLVWTDPPGTPPIPEGTLNPTDKILVNDLDLRIRDASSTHLPWVLNPASPASPATVADNNRDNVEQVVVNGAEPGAYFVEISHKGTLLDGLDQNFSLIISVVPRTNFITSTLEYVDFNSGLPSGWSMPDPGFGATWSIGLEGSENPREVNQTGGTGDFAWVDNNLQITNTELRTASYDMSNYTDVSLKFKSHFQFTDWETANVEVSTNDGTTWTNVWQLFGFALPSIYVVDLTNVAAGQPSVRIRFRYETAGDPLGELWQIDDIELIVSHSTTDGGGTCGNGYHLPANQWRLISLPCKPGVSNTVSDLFGDDLDIADYYSRWVMFTRDEAADQYVQLAPGDPLTQGEGIFLFSLDAGVLDTTGTETPLDNSPDCPSLDGNCFEIPLIKPVDSLSERPNMLGHPLPYPVNWANFRLRVSGTPDSLLTPSEAEAQGLMMKQTYKYSGSAYVPFDDVTPGYDHGALGAFDGFWVRLMENSFDAGDMTLLVPNTRSDGVITTTSAVTENTSVQAIVYSSEYAISKTTKSPVDKSPPGLAKRDEHRKAHRQAGIKGEEWYVRLIVEATAEDLKDDGNVLGQLKDSSIGFDEHDLPEPAPFAPYLTIIFTQPGWGDEAGDYTSDFHPISRNNKPDTWPFVVVSDNHQREVTLSWQGPEHVLKNSLLIDLDTNEVIEPDKQGHYTFITGSERRNFAWEYVKRPVIRSKK